jgi:phospholipid-binding lipoprotein MlaA
MDSVRVDVTPWLAMRKLARVAVILAVALVAACATVPDDPEELAAFEETNDPLEPLNRYFFEVHRGLDELIFKPFATVYQGAVPDFIQDGIRNFLDNLTSPVIFINQLLQGEVDAAGDTFGRFLANTFIGLGGLFDVTDIPKHDEDFGQTLAVWGVPEGPYLFLPVLGPRPPRNLAGLAVDSFVLDPVYWWAESDKGESWVPPVRYVLNGIDFRARNLETFDEIERSSIDYYAAVRSLYRQQRAEKIRNGRPAEGADEDDPWAKFDEDDDEQDSEDEEPAKKSTE